MNFTFNFKKTSIHLAFLLPVVSVCCRSAATTPTVRYPPLVNFRLPVDFAVD
ncbi:hypothetical protein PR003_g12615 [Phytophthora rubi]|uniref:RxLR effector protein n=1 Tax=Phytophthora rubi TaxID=129364 RepID=A0A6A3N3X6_9STRA|nr:hypothetical protein PR002_g10291 [Phytophthora rubi]KAE9036310.1 hypothetical protein PR001_g8889 [Phytophthora rubi]KAE9336223.1 hypothetical protein PR003_g12615 [Phytophthora rubi]